MKLYIVLVLGSIIADNRASSRHQNKVHQTAAELAKLIHQVSEFAVEESGSDEEVAQPEDRNENANLQPFDIDYFTMRNKNPQVLKTIMGFLQNQHGDEGPDVRFHIIRNPRVLEKYKRGIKHPAKSINSHGQSEEAVNFQDVLDLRRNAIFRFEQPSGDKSMKTKADDNTKKINTSKSKDHKFGDTIDNFDEFEKDQDDIKNNVDVFLDDDKEIRKKGGEDDSMKQDNAWDFITKKYDWDEPKNAYDNKEKKKLRKKKRKREFDDWDKEVTKHDLEDWDGKNEKKPKKKEEFDSYQPKGKNEWDTPYTISTFETTRKRKTESNDDWNKAYPKKSYYKPSRPNKRDNFDKSGGFFGRTPIPYVGRQGIYAD